MDNILTHIEFADIKQISKKYDEDKLTQAITEAHGDLQEILGEAFFYNVVKNQEEAAYLPLLNGAEFIKDECALYHNGLKNLVADYAYIRYLYQVNVNHTPFGLVGKNSNDSTPVDRYVIKDIIKQTNIDASRKWELIKDYLNVKKDVFEVWSKVSEGCGVDNSPSGFNSKRFTFFGTNKH